MEKRAQSDDFMRIQDLWYLCVGKWYWFVISLAVAIGIAAVYLLTTPPVYTRQASLLIKEDGKGGSASDVSGVLGDLDLFQTGANVNNEMQSLQSPSVMLDVVKRLHLDIGYRTDGTFYKQVLYGQACPYVVEFLDLQDNDGASFTIQPVDGNGQLSLADFVVGEDDYDVELAAVPGDTVGTPAGRIIVRDAVADTVAFDAPVYVSRTGYRKAAEAYSANLSVALSDDKSTVINLSFKDVTGLRIRTRLP